MVVGRCHCCHPSVVALLKILANLLARQRHYAQIVLVAVELIHVSQSCRTALHGYVKRQRTGKRNVCSTYAQHHVMHEVYESARTEIAVA